MLEEMVERAKILLNYQGDIKVKIKPLKTSLARVSFKCEMITLHPVVLNLNEEEIFYVILHEIAHLKARTQYHSLSFWREITRVFPEEKARELEDKIMGKLAKEIG